jgi:hypothetical protein
MLPSLNHHLSTLNQFGKAGRYKLAPKAFGAGCTCPENRIGIIEVGALPTPSARLRHRCERVAKSAASKRSEDGLNHDSPGFGPQANLIINPQP